MVPQPHPDRGPSWPLPASGRAVLEVACGPEMADVVADRMLQLGASAVAEADAADGVALSADLTPDAVAEMRSWCHEAGLAPPVERRCDPEAAEQWLRSGVEAQRVGPLLVRPPWSDEPVAAGDVEVVIDPGPTFGSGSHPTTRLCLAALLGLVRGGERVLDVGVGSGILAVAALRLGAGSADGVDIDPASAAVSRANAERNGVADRYRFLDTEISSGGGPGGSGGYDLVLANLLIPAIEDLAAGLRHAAAPGGAIVLSGILDSQRDRALAALGHATTPRPPSGVPKELSEDGWSALVLT